MNIGLNCELDTVQDSVNVAFQGSAILDFRLIQSVFVTLLNCLDSYHRSTWASYSIDILPLDRCYNCVTFIDNFLKQASFVCFVSKDKQVVVIIFAKSAENPGFELKYVYLTARKENLERIHASYIRMENLHWRSSKLGQRPVEKQ